MRRREFIALMGASVIWPFAAMAQEPGRTYRLVTLPRPQLEKAIAKWTPQQREAFELNGSRIVALYAFGQVAAGIAAAEQLVKRQTARTGEKSFDTAAARGVLAVGYARAGHDADAIREFKAAIPIMMTAARENADDDDPTVVAARSARLQRIVEAYIGVLARGTGMSNETAVETFALADAVRGRSVRRLRKAAATTSSRPISEEQTRTKSWSSSKRANQRDQVSG